MSSRHKNNMNSFLRNGHNYGSKKGYSTHYKGTPSRTPNQYAKLLREAEALNSAYASKPVAAPNEILEAIMQYILNDLPKSLYTKMHFVRTDNTNIRVTKNKEYCEANRWERAYITVNDDAIKFVADPTKLLFDDTMPESPKVDIKVQLADPDLFDHIYNSILRIYNT